MAAVHEELASWPEGTPWREAVLEAVDVQAARVLQVAARSCCRTVQLAGGVQELDVEVPHTFGPRPRDPTG